MSSKRAMAIGVRYAAYSSHMADPLKNLIEQTDALLKRWDALLPLSPAALANFRQHWDVVHTYNSNAIEGNTLTLGETKAVLLDGITISGKPLREILEATNHREAMGLLYRLAESRSPITEQEILDLHRIILTGIQSNNAGRYRTIRVRVPGSQYVFPNAAKVPSLMADLITGTVSESDHPIRVAARAHYRFVAIHPFADGNGRTARLLMNLLLMRSGYPPACLPIERRGDYYDLLDAAHVIGTPCFEEFIAECVRDSLEDSLQGLD